MVSVWHTQGQEVGDAGALNDDRVDGHERDTRGRVVVLLWSLFQSR